MTDPIEQSESFDGVVFPQLSALNWPSYLLETWRTLAALGVPEQNIRFVPEIGHFAAPEISVQEPPGPVYDPLGERLIVHRVDPAEVRPRLTVSVRADELNYFQPNPVTGTEERQTRIVGRLAHFLPPLLAGLPGAAPAEMSAIPLETLAAQVNTAYPELCAVLPNDVRQDLEIGVGAVLKALAARDPAEQADALKQVSAQQVAPTVRAVLHAAWMRMADKLPAQGIQGVKDIDLPAALTLFRQWADVLYGPHLEAAPPFPFWTELSLEDALHQRILLAEMEIILSYETLWGRGKIIHEFLEIMTTEAFLATAVLDSLHGIGWAHGRIADMAAANTDLEGWFLSVSGGPNSRSLLQSRLMQWAASEDGVVGVGKADLAALDETEQAQLWALVAWRRETADPIVLLETAAQRLIHPESTVQWTRYVPAPSRPGTLLAQPGGTAVLGGAALLLYPGVRIQVPVSDAGDEGARARSVLRVLLRVFLPVCCRVEVLWRESAARLDQPTYLRHEFQQGVALSGAGTTVKEEKPLSDPAAL